MKGEFAGKLIARQGQSAVTAEDVMGGLDAGTAGTFIADGSGNISARTIVVYPGNSDAIALVVQDGTTGTSNNWTEWRTSAGTLETWVSNAGIVRTIREVQVFVLATDTEPAVRLNSAALDFGVGGGSSTDTVLYRLSAGVLKTDGRMVAPLGVTSLYIHGAGKVKGADSDFLTAPDDGTMYTVKNDSTGKVYLTTRAGGSWFAVEVT